MTAFNCLYQDPTGRLPPTNGAASFSIYSLDTIHNQQDKYTRFLVGVNDYFQINENFDAPKYPN